MSQLDSIRIDDHKLTQHPLEVARWMQAQDTWEGVKELYPIYVEISPFGGCNFRCSFCAKDFLGYQRTKIEPDVLKRTLRIMKAKGVKSILFAGEGEPLLYPELGDIFSYAAEIGLDTALNTNAATKNIPAWESAAKNCRWIRASVNAGNSKDHSDIHKVPENIFEKVMENLGFAVSARNASGSTCVIGAQAVLLDNNRDSMVDLARRVRALGVDYLVLKPYSQHPESLTHVHKGTQYADIDNFARQLKSEETEKFKVFMRTAAFKRANMNGHSFDRCHSVPNFWAYIRSNGDVSGCNAFLTDEKFRYGNLNDADFDKIWEGDLRRASFERMKTHDLNKCRVNCRMENVNRYLWELKNPGLHVNFI